MQNTSGPSADHTLFPGVNPIEADTMTGKWSHIVGTFAGAASPTGTVAETLFVNGVPVSMRSETLADTSGGGRTVTVDVHIGVQSGASPSGTYTRYWNGLLDEVRVQSRARSVDWVKLEYANQRPAGQNLAAYSPPVSIGGVAASRAVMDLAVRAAGRGLVFQLQGAPDAGAVLSLMDVWGRTVWSGAFANGRLAWNGRTAGGSSAAAGVYLARVTVRDSQGKTLGVLDQRIPLTR
jgi:hypothetical protein